MEYVQGESFVELIRRTIRGGATIPFDIASGIICGVLAGLQAAHTATHDDGDPLGIVHRDVSPENILVGADGVARVLDFGVAKATGGSSVTKEGTVKGKLAYMAPEQALGDPLSPATDVFSVCAVLWEALTGRRLFKGATDAATLHRILHEPIPSPKRYRSDLPEALEQVMMKGLNRAPADRFESAEAMHRALEEAFAPATSRRIAEWLKGVAGESLALRASKLAAVESSSALPCEEPASANPVVVQVASTEIRLAAFSERLIGRRPKLHKLYPLVFAAVVASGFLLTVWMLKRSSSGSPNAALPGTGLLPGSRAQATASAAALDRATLPPSAIDAAATTATVVRAPQPETSTTTNAAEPKKVLPKPPATALSPAVLPALTPIPKAANSSLYSRD
jgi:eukaryotic-like serine/threonine-protein kinase